ncbi:hypothetical protein FRB90_007772, partial [Tulasnella sp. 427]
PPSIISSNPTKTKSPTQVDSPGSKRHRNYTRIVRRRGRARDDDIEGNGFIEHAALSDSESEPSDEDDTASKADDNDDAEEVPGGTAVPEASSSLTADTVPTPETDETSPPDKPAEDTSAAVTAEPQKEVPQLWSDAVAEEKAGKGEDLPKKRRKKKRAKGTRARLQSRMIARQSYLKKLNSDPAAIPKVGQFHGHGDRLMDTELPIAERLMEGKVEARPADPIEERWTHDAYEEHEKQVSARERGRRGTGRGHGRGDRDGRGGLNGIASPTPDVTVVQVQLQAQAAAERRDAGPLTGKKPKRAVKNPRAKVLDVLAQTVKERETEKAQGVVTVAKSGVAAAGQQAGTSSFASASVANAAPTANGAQVQVNLPGSAAHTGGQHQPTAPPPRTRSRRPPAKEFSPDHHQDRRAVLKESFTKATSSAGASDAVASPPAAQPPITVNAPLVTQPSTNPRYSYVALPPGIAMGESGILFEIATGRPVFLNPQAAAPPAPTPPLPRPTMSSGDPVYSPRPLPHSHVSRPGGMFYISPHEPVA